MLQSIAGFLGELTANIVIISFSIWVTLRAVEKVFDILLKMKEYELLKAIKGED